MDTNEKEPLVSVVIPAYNEEKLIGKTLETIKQQTYKKLEIIVVDNNSTDNTAKICREYDVTVIKEERKGVGYARQKGCMAAKGDIIVMSDADIIAPPDWTILLKIIY